VCAPTLRITLLAALALGGGAPRARAQAEAAPAEAAPPGEEPAGLRFEEQVVVTAGKTEQRLRDLPVAATVLTGEEVRRASAQTVGDLLRQVPSFNLNRAESTRTATPPTSAVSLRSLGGGSSSRALVLVDGVPLNDPFFGWIAWSQVARSSIERIEVVPAGAAGAWGNQALGGVIHILTRHPARSAVDLDARVGSLGTEDVELGGTYARGPLRIAPRVAYFDTQGYVLLAEEDRGPIDIKSGSDNHLLEARVEYQPSPGTRWTLLGSRLEDDHLSGTPLNTDHVEVGTVRLGGAFSTGGGGTLHVDAFGQQRDGRSTRGTVNADRTLQVPTRNQFEMPSSSLGLGLTWSRPLSSRHLLSAGADVVRTEGEVHDDSRFVGGHFTRRALTGGTQLLVGVHAQDTAVLGPRWRAVAGARLDLWEATDGRDFLQDLDTGDVLKDERFAARTAWLVNPNLGLLFQATERLGLRGTVYRTFRAPTPSEMYRSVAVGSRNFNAANPDLEPERITVGFETGLDYTFGGGWSSRVTGFWNAFENAINDVTVGTAGRTPQEIAPCGLVPAGGSCREKQNLDRIRNRGAEVELRLRPHRDLGIAAAYTYASSTVTSAPNAPQLVGKRLRRVPDHQFSVRAEYSSPRVLTASLLCRYLGDRYADDLNTTYVADSAVLDLALSRSVGSMVEVYAVAENLLDTDFVVDNTSDGLEYGHPRVLHAGVRLRWERGPGGR
jgi:outer membrane receptor protein involved in Fe transport